MPDVVTELVSSDAPLDIRFFHPAGIVSHGHGAYIDFNVKVSICGLTISPGDLLHGDESGLLNIPLDIADQVANEAQNVRNSENDFFEFIKGESFSMEELARRSTAHP